MDQDKFLGCIFGVAIGDALGMPVETMTARQIQKNWGGLAVPAFTSPPVAHSLVSLRNLQPGFWTDDTQLTLATTEALIESNGVFDMDKIAQKHIEAYMGERRGWGKSTINACKRLAGGVSWQNSGEPVGKGRGGTGNGVLMKIAPLGLLQSVKDKNPDEFRAECVQYAKMTHLGTQAIIAGTVHAAAIAYLAQCPLNGPRTDPLGTSAFLSYLKQIALNLELELKANGDKISEQIDRISQYLREYVLAKRPRPSNFASWFGGGNAYAYNSFGLSYGLFVEDPNSFSPVWQAVLAGGDTDSNASIVGSLCGALNGVYLIPGHLLSGLERREYIENLAKKFFEACR